MAHTTNGPDRPTATAHLEPGGREEVRRRILDATWKRLAERGFGNTRVQDIAAAAGTSTGTVHYYFPGKDGVIAAAVEYCADLADAYQQTELSTIEDSRERMLRLIELYLPTEAPVRSRWPIWTQLAGLAALDPRLADIQRELHHRWAESVCRILRRGRRQQVFTDRATDETADTFLSMVDGLAARVLAGSIDTHQMRELLVRWAEHELFVAPPPKQTKTGKPTRQPTQTGQPTQARQARPGRPPRAGGAGNQPRRTGD